MPKRFLLLLSLSLALAAGVPAGAWAQDIRQHLAQPSHDGGGMSLNQAVQQVQRETGGRVLSADTVNQGGRSVHRIKVLTSSGQVHVMTINARSGDR